MAKCPHCGEEVDYLIAFYSVRERAEFSLFCGEPVYESIEFVGFGESEYSCPGCGKLLFTDEKDAVEFLRGVNR